MPKGALEAGCRNDPATATALETASTVAGFLAEDAQQGARLRGEAPAALPRAL